MARVRGSKLIHRLLGRSRFRGAGIAGRFLAISTQGAFPRKLSPIRSDALFRLMRDRTSRGRTHSATVDRIWAYRLQRPRLLRFEHCNSAARLIRNPIDTTSELDSTIRPKSGGCVRSQLAGNRTGQERGAPPPPLVFFSGARAVPQIIYATGCN